MKPLFLDRPPNLEGEALELWHRVGAELIARGMLTVMHRVSFTAWCVLGARVLEERRNGVVSLETVREFNAWNEMMRIPEDIRAEFKGEAR